MTNLEIMLHHLRVCQGLLRMDEELMKEHPGVYFATMNSIKDLIFTLKDLTFTLENLPMQEGK